MTLRFLVIEGNNAEGRERQRTRLGRMASEGYSGCLRYLAPGSVTDICMPADEGANLPSERELREAYDGVVITGSALHVWEGHPDALRQVAFARTVFRAGVPFFGSCWGLQVASAAAGGTVEKNPLGREAGIARAITLNEKGLRHPMLAGRPGVFDAPCVHLDAVTEPAPGTTILASNAMAPVQAAEIHHEGGVFWGVQYHPEFTLTHLANILSLSLPMHVEEGRFADEAQGEAWCNDMRSICRDPSLSHVAWRYGLGPELLDRQKRLTEIGNFIEHWVKPHAIKRAAA
ncbi:MAG TPA: type 1 glutamine amidotransferase [Beijerinckiaceae bacterium]|nr:type 1 glutamine amidotransferase [Beijerinckiaceae bacterium]